MTGTASSFENMVYNIFIMRLISLLLCAAVLAACSSEEAQDRRVAVRLAAPQSSYIADFDTNLYKLWLEERTGLKLEMTWLPAEDAEHIVARQLETGEDLPDAYIGFGSSSYQIFQNPNIQRYGERGLVIPLNEFIEKYGAHTKTLFDELPEYNIQALMTSADGRVYFMPGFSSSPITRYRNLMWVNRGWLEALGLSPPATTDEFAAMLAAFKSAYPDRIPMAGTEAHYGKQAYNYLINAFIYNDTENTRLLAENGRLGFAPVKDEWRTGLRYIRGLYEKGLYWPLSFTQDNQQMNQMASDNRDILGAFLSPGITLTVSQNSPEILRRYIGIGPLEGPGGVKLSTAFTPLPRPNGVITSACEYPEEVFRLFDLMLSEEACLMGRYGERGVDWDFAEAGEISIYGTPATIRVINQIWNTKQNKHLAQIGPYVSRPKYSGGVSWDGNKTDGEYMSAQAALLHQGFEPDEFVRTLVYTPEEEQGIHKIREDIEAHINKSIIAFITGERDVRDDSQWRDYIAEFDALGLQAFIAAAQTAYDRWR
uniref:ABC transporter, substrate-binding protein n=1 Tax=uncultured bacterium contig00062 TaxID=1181545 RepID=A0A806KK01_9BACT|nr:ABC transporter, substrate-binding protein [uncultured bacterium contig00062]